MLLGIGAGLVGTYIIAVPLRSRLYSLLISVSACMGAIAVALIAYGQSTLLTYVLLSLWAYS